MRFFSLYNNLLAVSYTLGYKKSVLKNMLYIIIKHFIIDAKKNTGIGFKRYISYRFFYIV